MIEPTEYPEAWGVFCQGIGGWFKVANSETGADSLATMIEDGYSDSGYEVHPEIVRLIPEPTVEREARHNYGIWSRWVGVVKGLLLGPPEGGRGGSRPTGTT